MSNKEQVVALEMELINLMGYENPVLGKQTQKIHAKTPANQGKPAMKEFAPWGRDNGACLSLCNEHNVALIPGDQQVSARFVDDNAVEVGRVDAQVADHPDKDAALRFVGLSAVIAKFKYLKGR